MNTHGKYLHKRPSGTMAELNDIAKGILTSFFEDYDLDFSQAQLWHMIQQSSYSKKAILSDVERCNLIAFYERVHELILAGSLINDHHKANEVETK